MLTRTRFAVAVVLALAPLGGCGRSNQPIAPQINNSGTHTVTILVKEMGQRLNLL
jgi:hypothetical protein